MVMPLQNHINAKLRHKGAQLLAQLDHIVVVKVRAVGIRSLVQRHDLPLCVALRRILFQPFHLILAQALLFGEVIGVKHHKVRIVIIKRIINAARRILLRHIGQNKILIDRKFALCLMVARRRHEHGFHQAVSARVEEPLPLVCVVALIHMVSRVHDEIRIRIHFICRVEHLRPRAAILTLALGLAVAHMEEGQLVGTVSRFNHACIAPPALLRVAHAEAVFFPSLQARDLYHMARYVKIIREQAKHADIDARELELRGLFARLYLHARGQLIAKLRVFTVGNNLDIRVVRLHLRAVHRAFGIPVDVARCRGIRAEGHADI